MERKRITDLIVLGFIYYKPAHGYTIYEILSKHNIEKFMDFSKATIYNSLKRSQKDNFVESEIIENDNKPPKTVYKITDVGVKYLTNLIEESIISKKFESIFVYNLGYNFHHLIDYNRLIELFKNKLTDLKILKEQMKIKKSNLMHSQLEHFEILMDSNFIHITTEIDKVEKTIDLYERKPKYISEVKEKIDKIINIYFNK